MEENLFLPAYMTTLYITQEDITSYPRACKRDISYATAAFVSITAVNFGLEIAKRQNMLQIA